MMQTSKLIKVSLLKEHNKIKKDVPQYFIDHVKEFGVIIPITIDSNYIIIDGNVRFSAAVLAKLDIVPCKMIIKFSEKETYEETILSLQKRVKELEEQLEDILSRI